MLQPVGSLHVVDWRKDFLRLHQRAWNYLHRYSTFSCLVKGGQAVALGLLLAGATLGISLKEAQAQVQAQANRAGYEQTTRGLKENTLGTTALHYGMNDEILTSHNYRAKPILVCITHYTCIPGKGLASEKRRSTHTRSRISRNVFPHGQCTWWANQRYFQLHGVFVPWRTGADAWEWKFRAYQFHWRVSNKPTPGAIIDLQPWTQGAYGFGHVAIVERVLRNGRVIASTMNWGAHPWRVTYVTFAPGPGVSFISQF